MIRILRFALVLCAAAGLMASSANAGGKVLKTIDVDWLKPNFAAVAEGQHSFASINHIGQDGAADTSAWFQIDNITWNPLVDNAALMSATTFGLSGVGILSDTVSVCGWVRIFSDTTVSTVTSCSLYVETASPGSNFKDFTLATGLTNLLSHKWVASANNVVDNLSSYSLEIPLLAANVNASPWRTGHTQARIILVAAGGVMRKSRLQVSYWIDAEGEKLFPGGRVGNR